MSSLRPQKQNIGWGVLREQKGKSGKCGVLKAKERESFNTDYFQYNIALICYEKWVSETAHSKVTDKFTNIQSNGHLATQITPFVSYFLSGSAVKESAFSAGGTGNTSLQDYVQDPGQVLTLILKLLLTMVVGAHESWCERWSLAINGLGCSVWCHKETFETGGFIALSICFIIKKKKML